MLGQPFDRLPYRPTAIAVGLVLAWVPSYLHGPIPEKYDLLYIQGSLAVWCWYVARMSIGFWIAATAWPRRWFIRGPLCGFFAMLPPSLMSLATPGCGEP